MIIKTTKIVIYNLYNNRVYMVLNHSDDNMKLTSEILGNLNTYKLKNEYFTMCLISEIVGGNENE